MAAQRRTRRYETYGSVAYQPEYSREYQRGTAAPARRPQEPERQRRPRVQPRTQTAVRPSVEVRPQGAVAPFAIIGFAAVILCALLLVVSSAQLAVANAEIVALNGTLEELQGEEQSLVARYELAFDLKAIEEMLLAEGIMVKPAGDQTVYMDMSGGDSVVYYEAATGGLSGLIRQVEEFFSRPAE